MFDALGVDLLRSIFPEVPIETLKIRREDINIPCLIRSIFSVSFWRGRLRIAYHLSYVEFSRPRVVVTFNDNSKSFWELSTELSHKNIRTCLIQNGIRGLRGDIFEMLSENERFKVDYMFLFGEAVAALYKKYVEGTVFTLGSFKNNSIDRAEGKQHALTYVSNFPSDPSPRPLLVDALGREISHAQFIEAERQLFRRLDVWCADKCVKLSIVGRNRKGTPDEMQEFDFYKGLLRKCDWVFIPKESEVSSYEVVDRSQNVICIDSTLGYESLARGTRTAFFFLRGKYIDCESRRFGWPGFPSGEGYFWTDDLKDGHFEKIMDFCFNGAEKDWTAFRVQHLKDTMAYSPENSIFTQVMLSCLHLVD